MDIALGSSKVVQPAVWPTTQATNIFFCCKIITIYTNGSTSVHTHYIAIVGMVISQNINLCSLYTNKVEYARRNNEVQ